MPPTENPLPPVSENRWVGMHADESAKLPPGVVQYAQNYLLEDGLWRPRPGMSDLGSVLAADSKVQGIVDYQELDGTLHTLAFANANMYEYDWAQDQWTETDLSSEGITMDPSSDLDFANSRGRLIVTDGVNKPWMWDGDDEFTVLTAAPIARGVCIYYDRVFFYDIPGAENSFEWSHPTDPTDGYDGFGFSWEFAQTDQGAVTGLAPLNNSLVIFKQDSGAFLRGAVEDTFETDAVREGLSETEGCIARRSTVILDGDVFFLSQEGPRVALQGQRLLRINENENKDDRLRDVWAELDRSEWHTSFGFADTQNRRIWWFVPVTGDNGVYQALVYSVDEDAWQVFRTDAISLTAAAEVEDPDGAEHILLGGDAGRVVSLDPDATNDRSTAIEYILRSALHGVDSPMMVKRLVEVRLHLIAHSDIDFELRPYVDGTVGAATERSFSPSSPPELHRYRKGFNATGYTVGWEFYLSQLGQSCSVESALTVMTSAGSYATI